MPTFSSFFDLFPKINYDVKRINGSHPETVPNIFFRIGYVKKIINEIDSYDIYRLEEGDTPEIVAEKIYNDPIAGWMIIYANKIFDPQFDWPLNDSEFEAYIIGKYGSVEYAQSNIHHAEKTLRIDNLTDGTSFTTNTEISLLRYTNNMPDGVHFDYWAWNQIPTLGEYQPGTQQLSADSIDKKADDKEGTVTVDSDNILNDGGLGITSYQRQYNIDQDYYVETTSAKLVSIYDYEFQINDQKKFIKVVKSIYYNQLMNEFKNLTGHNSVQYTNYLTPGVF